MLGDLSRWAQSYVLERWHIEDNLYPLPGGFPARHPALNKQLISNFQTS